MNATEEQPVGREAAGRRPFYTQVAALGFLLIALMGLLSTLVGLLMGGMNQIAFTLPLLVVGLLVAAALMRFGAWAQIVAAVLSLLMLAGVLPFSSYLLVHPEDGAEFIPLVFLVVGAVLGFVGSVAGLVQRRRHTVRTTPTRAESLALRALLLAGALVVLVSIGLTIGGRTTVNADARAGATTIETKDFRFNPERLEVKPGQKVRLVVKNSDASLHTFTLDEAGVNVSISPGSERLVEFTAPAAGEYLYYCIPHSSPGAAGRTGMVGYLSVH